MSGEVVARSINNQSYLLGHSEAEIARLEQQAEYFSEQTTTLLRAAGLREGMRVLDLGCGAGDVVLAIAGIVGETGSILGVDRAPQAVATANARLAARGVTFARCVEADVSTADFADADAIVGRFLLTHLPAPAALIESVRRQARPGAIVAFLEMDVSSTAISPEVPLFVEAVDAIVETYRRAGAEPDMGSRLYATFRQAGLDPSLAATCRVEGGSSISAFTFLARTIRSLSAGMAAHGLMREEFDPDTLAECLHAAAPAGETTVVFPRLVGGWARL